MVHNQAAIAPFGSAAPRARGRVLVAEDNPDTLEALQLILTQRGYDVLVARDGHEALEQFHVGDPPCVIVLDLYMPRMSGFEFLTRRRDHPVLAQTPVIVVTGAEPVPTQGSDLVLRKPIDPERLLAVIDAACGAKGKGSTSSS